jgi:hypothetical protein
MRVSTKVEIEIPTKFYPNFVEISMLKSEFDLDFYVDIRISISESEFRFRHRNFDFSTGFLFQCRKLKAFLTEICQNFYFDCSSEFLFRPSKSKSKF